MAPGLREQEWPDLDPLRLLLHGLHVVVELRDVREPGEILLLLGHEVLDELVEVPILGQPQQAQMCHLVALEALTLALLAVFPCLRC